MPIYEFICNECSYEFEDICKVSETTLICPRCGEICERAISKNDFHLKGVGWSDDARKQKQRWFDTK